MRRRKLLISIGALGAGGTAAFGTEAFTSVEAERSVDVTVAGDESAFLAIQPLSGNNADEYVSTEDDDTVALDLDDGAGTDGSGVNQDAVTQVEDLFKIINQGTQPTSVFFEDDSDAVTFRVTRSTDTSTEGPSGESLEGADNSVELETGEQVAVGITVDTLNNDVSGSLVDDVTIRAEAGASAPGQNIPEPQFVVTPSPDSPNQFGDIQSAVDQLNSSNEDQSGAVIGIEGGFSETISGDNSSDITVDVSGITLTGFGSGSTPEIVRESDTEGLVVSADDVSVRNLKITDATSDGSQGQILNIDDGPSGVTIDGVTFDGAGEFHGGSVIGTDEPVGDNLAITNCEVQKGALGFNGSSDASAEITNNFIDAASGDGIFVTGASDLTIENNEATDVPSSNVGIRVTNSNATVNGATTTEDTLETLLAENGIDTAAVSGSVGTKATGSAFGSLQDAVDTASSDGVTLVESATFNEQLSVTDTDGFTLKAAPGADPVIEAASPAITIRGNTSAIVSGLKIEASDDSGDRPAIRPADGDVTITDTEVVGFLTQIGFDAFGDDPGPGTVTLKNNVFRSPRLVGIGQTEPFGDAGDDELNISGNTFVDVDQCIDLAPVSPIEDVLTPDDSDDSTRQSIRTTIENNTFKNITGDQYAVQDFNNGNIYEPDGEIR